MEVIEIRKSLEKCAEAGWYGFDFILGEPVSPDLINYFGDMGNLIFLSALKNPFFKVETHDLIIKGICGKSEIRVAVSSLEETTRLEELRKKIITFNF